MRFHRNHLASVQLDVPACNVCLVLHKRASASIELLAALELYNDDADTHGQAARRVLVVQGHVGAIRTNLVASIDHAYHESWWICF